MQHPIYSPRGNNHILNVIKKLAADGTGRAQYTTHGEPHD